MKPCNELEIVGIKSMDHSKDYYAGYDAAEKNYIRIFDKIRTEIEEHIKINQNLNTDRANALCWCLKIIDKYSKAQEDVR